MSTMESKKTKVCTITTTVKPKDGILSPDVLLSLCQWFSPRQLRALVQTCKTANKTLLQENEGYWAGVLGHLLFRREFIIELPKVDGTRAFPGFGLRMPDSIPVHNLYHMMGLDISRGAAYQLMIERIHEAIRANADTFPGWDNYVGLDTRAILLKEFDEKVDQDHLGVLQDQGWVGDVHRFDVSMRELAFVIVKQTCDRTPRVRAMLGFVNELENDTDFTPKQKRKLMRKLLALEKTVSSKPGRVYSIRELLATICHF